MEASGFSRMKTLFLVVPLLSQLLPATSKSAKHLLLETVDKKNDSVAAPPADNSKRVQSGASSHAKHGGAYFSAVCGSIEDPMAAPGPCENLGPPFLGGSAQLVTFVLPLAHTQLPLINGHSSRICSEAGLMYLFGDKYIRPVPEQILLQCPLRSGSSVCICEGQNKSDRLSTATQKWGS